MSLLSLAGIVMVSFEKETQKVRALASEHELERLGNRINYKERLWFEIEREGQIDGRAERK